MSRASLCLCVCVSPNGLERVCMYEKSVCGDMTERFCGYSEEEKMKLKVKNSVNK